jgi:2-dehydropantoate 2-reductase
MLNKMKQAVSILQANKTVEAAGKHKFVKKGSGISWDICYRKRKSETSHLTGALIEDAHRLWVNVPLNEKLVSMIYEIEDGKRELGWHNIEELEKLINELGIALP